MNDIERQILGVRDEPAQSQGRSEPTSRIDLTLHKAGVVLAFLWWMVKVADWFWQSRGLNRVEFPKFRPGSKQ